MESSIYSRPRPLAFVPLLFALAACSHGVMVEEFPDTANPRVELAQVEQDLESASSNQVNVLAPANFRKAKSAAEDARRDLEKQKDSKGVLHEVAEARAYLGLSNQFANVSRTNLGDVVEARRRALAANAPALFASDFREADERLTEVTSDVEDNDVDPAAKHRSELQTRYLELELRAIQQTALGPARSRIKMAEEEGAERHAPRSLAIAAKSLKDAEGYIIANRHEIVQIKALSDRTAARAEHVLKITRDAKAGKVVSAEDNALMYEAEQDKVVLKQEQLEERQSQLDGARTDLKRQTSASAVLTSKNRELESEDAFNRSFEEARAEFQESEADVYKQGNTLKIRLKALAFPVAKSELRGSSFSLLSKVQKVIRRFGNGSVVIEGHTDSMGNNASNKTLSSARAEAVKDYFVSNGIDASRIEAVGFGDEKPLASNKTAGGRAQNRRVDIHIKAEKSQGG